MNFCLYLQQHHIMKQLTFILALMVFALSVYPCIDEFDSHLLQNQSVTQTTHHNHHHDAFDLCSPFCTCQCCHTLVVVSEKMEIFPVFQEHTCYCEYLSDFQSIEYSELLIPPKA
jgi:hypothetical protein